MNKAGLVGSSVGQTENDLQREPIDSVISKFKTGEYVVAIYGLGHVGAPLASTWLRAGIKLIGIDKSPKVLENAKKGLTHIPEPNVNESYAEGIKENRFVIYDDPIKASQDSKLKMMCVPVLMNRNKPDFAALKEVAMAIGKGLKKHDIVSVHPSLPPTTTEKFLIPLLEKTSGLHADSDFSVIYNPERIYEGRAIYDIEEGHPGIISANNAYDLQLGSALFSLIFKKGVVKMFSIKAAEAEKLFEGVYRDVNISLANELAKLCDRLGIDFWEAKEAANSQSYCHIHDPGIGVGGACIPIYPQFIIDVATKNKISCKITKLGRTVNNEMPSYTLSKALKMLGRGQLRKSKITILGLAFRGGVSDTRLSPTYDLLRELVKLKIKDVIVHDPLVKDDALIKKFKNATLVSDLNYAITGRDLIILATNHKEYLELNSSAVGSTPIYDGRGYLDKRKFEDSFFAGIGRPSITKK
ncbi:MAG TPA: nucleotide sugar dehydrogenase [Candidatus Nitrosocosmicus sp.]|nr:nucleotide sugar dehydrogenase [Candidatus Nitrosocosmicus sp.]